MWLLILCFVTFVALIAYFRDEVRPLISDASSWISAKLPMPKARPGTFTVAVAQLNNDPDGKYTSLIVQDLQTVRGIDILPLNRTIPLEPNRFHQSASSRPDISKAHLYLKESGAQVLVWGSVLRSDQRTVPDLLLTPNGNVYVREGRYSLTDDLNLPIVFWGQLAEALEVALTSVYVASVTQNGLTENVVRSFVKRVDTLLRDTDGQQGWSQQTRDDMRYLIATTYGDLGFEAGKAEYNKKDIALCDNLLKSYQHKAHDERWLFISNQRATAELQLAASERGERASALLIDSISNFRSDLGSVDSAVREQVKETPPPLTFNIDREILSEKAEILANLGSALYALGTLIPDIAQLHEAAKANREAAKDCVLTDDAPGFVAVMVNLGGVLKSLSDRGEGASYFSAANLAYQNAINVANRLGWADVASMAESDDADVLVSLGKSDRGPKGTVYLKQAVETYRNRLLQEQSAKRTDWYAYLGIAEALGLLGQRDAGPKGISELAEAVRYYRLALNPFEPESKPGDWFKGQINLAITLGFLAERRKDPRLFCESAARSIAAEHNLASKSDIEGDELMSIQANAADSIQQLRMGFGDSVSRDCLEAIQKLKGKGWSIGKILRDEASKDQ